MTSTGFVGDVLSEFARSFEPLADGLEGGADFSAFLGELGWVLDPGSDAGTLITALGQIPGDLESLFDKVDDFVTAPTNNLSAIAEAVANLVTAIKALVDHVSALSQTTANTLWPAPLNSSSFWSIFPQELLEYLLYRRLEERVPVLFASLRLLGVLSEEFVAPPGPDRVPYTRRGLRWDRLVSAVTRPQHLLADVYGWGGSFAAHQLLDNLQALALAVRLPAGVQEPAQHVLDWYYDPGAASRRDAYEFSLPLFWSVTQTATTLAMVGADIAALPIPPAGNRTAAAVGLAIYPRVIGSAETQFQLTSTVHAQFRGGLAADGAVRAELRPGSATVFVDPNLGASIDASASIDGQPPQPWVLLGRRAGTRLEVGHLHAAIEVRGSVADLELILQMAAESGALVVDFGDADSFLRRFFGTQAQRAGLDLAIAWSNKTGLRISGQGHFELSIPTHQNLGPVSLSEIFLALRGDTTGRFVLEVAVSGGFALGPIAATAERLGLALRLQRAITNAGNLGLFDLQLGFRPPNGLGLSVKAGAVRGGGYLFCDAERGEYAGILELSFGVLSLKAIGLLTTRLPDGRPGFSLLVIITAEFPPIQLGFGFALTGVGGLLGIQRTMNVDALRDGVRTRTLDGILFPVDPVRNAAHVIASVRAVFPPAEGRYTFGPMIRLAWGPTSILELEAAVILELPSPLRLAILGRLTLVLPDKRAAVTLLSLHVVGILDLDRGEVSVDAMLFDSRIATFPVSGDMAFRMGWKANKLFAMSAGGFNPRFPTPAGFPALQRLAISLCSGDNPRLRITAYFALTPTSIQFGGAIDLYAGLDTFLGTFSVSARASIDALIMDPFAFALDFAISVDVELNHKPILHAHLAVTLEGTTPWHAYGTAEISVLTFKGHVAFDQTFGEPAAPQRPLIAIWPILETALTADDAWSALPPTRGAMDVTLRPPAADDGLLVHPLGRCTVHQRAVPLDLTLTRFGSGLPLGDETRFSISDIAVGGSTSASPELVRDDFAIAQFVDLPDDQRLSRPAFEPLPAGAYSAIPGYRLPQDATDALIAIGVDPGYDEAVIDVRDDVKQRRAGGGVRQPAPPPTELDPLFDGGAAARAGGRSADDPRAGGPDRSIAVVAETYVDAARETVPTRDATAVQRGTTYAQAAERGASGRQLVTVAEVAA